MSGTGRYPRKGGCWEVVAEILAEPVPVCRPVGVFSDSEVVVLETSESRGAKIGSKKVGLCRNARKRISI
jgi:hypothetical protein